MSRKQEVNNIPVWINEDQACSLLGVKSETLRKKCRAGEYAFKIVKKDKATSYNILFSSLPEKVQNKHLNVSNLNIKTYDIQYSDAPEWAKNSSREIHNNTSTV